MKCIIVGRKEFQVSLDKEQIELIAECARAHYDGVCKASAIKGGFVYGWLNYAAFDESEAKRNHRGIKPTVCYGDFGTFDTCLKILEVKHHLLFNNAQKYRMALDLSESLRQLLEQSNAINWRKELYI